MGGGALTSCETSRAPEAATPSLSRLPVLWSGQPAASPSLMSLGVLLGRVPPVQHHHTRGFPGTLGVGSQLSRGHGRAFSSELPISARVGGGSSVGASLSPGGNGCYSQVLRTIYTH